MLVIADSSCKPEVIAADLIAQAQPTPPRPDPPLPEPQTEPQTEPQP